MIFCIKYKSINDKDYFLEPDMKFSLNKNNILKSNSLKMIRETMHIKIFNYIIEGYKPDLTRYNIELL